jgi:hypothetical protein
METNDNLSDEPNIIEVKSKTNTKEYNQQYYIKNKEKIIAHVHKNVTCPICNKETKYQHLNRHQKSSYCEKAKIKQQLADLQQSLIKNADK